MVNAQEKHTEAMSPPVWGMEPDIQEEVKDSTETRVSGIYFDRRGG